MNIDKYISHYIPVIVLILVMACMMLIPLKVAGYGFLPYDDALRHSTKVVSDKAWSEILVLRGDKTMDHHAGWHAMLGAVHKFTGWDQRGLVVFSVIILFVLFTFIPIFWLDRPEAWTGALLVLAVTNRWLIERLFFGRPYIFMMAVILILSLLWPRLKKEKKPYKEMLLITGVTALATWAHGSWYLLALPVVSFFLAREWRIGYLVGLSILAGVIIGSVLTGHPYLFLKENYAHMLLTLGDSTPTRLLVGELQPFNGDPLSVIAVFGLLIWRSMRGAWNSKAVDNPVFILAVLGWVLGFVIERFWFDWGMPAISVWMAWELQEAFGQFMKFFSWKRIFLTLAVTLVFYIAMTNDAGARWTHNLTTEYLSLDNPEQREWLPDEGGIVYSDSMSVFYEMFFKNPAAPWRYILGFESGLMPPEDLAIYRNIRWNYGAYQAFEPWVRKMKPADRLILHRPSPQAPDIPGLEWHYAASETWIGRLPKNKK